MDAISPELAGLVVVTGEPGAGKTERAMQIAATRPGRMTYHAFGPGDRLAIADFSALTGATLVIDEVSYFDPDDLARLDTLAASARLIVVATRGAGAPDLIDHLGQRAASPGGAWVEVGPLVADEVADLTSEDTATIDVDEIIRLTRGNRALAVALLVPGAQGDAPLCAVKHYIESFAPDLAALLHLVALLDGAVPLAPAAEQLFGDDRSDLIARLRGAGAIDSDERPIPLVADLSPRLAMTDRDELDRFRAVAELLDAANTPDSDARLFALMAHIDDDSLLPRSQGRAAAITRLATLTGDPLPPVASPLPAENHSEVAPVATVEVGPEAMASNEAGQEERTPVTTEDRAPRLPERDVMRRPPARDTRDQIPVGVDLSPRFAELLARAEDDDEAGLAALLAEIAAAAALDRPTLDPERALDALGAVPGARRDRAWRSSLAVVAVACEGGDALTSARLAALACSLSGPVRQRLAAAGGPGELAALARMGEWQPLWQLEPLLEISATHPPLYRARLLARASEGAFYSRGGAANGIRLAAELLVLVRSSGLGPDLTRTAHRLRFWGQLMLGRTAEAGRERALFAETEPASAGASAFTTRLHLHLMDRDLAAARGESPLDLARRGLVLADDAASPGDASMDVLALRLDASVTLGKLPEAGVLLALLLPRLVKAPIHRLGLIDAAFVAGGGALTLGDDQAVATCLRLAERGIAAGIDESPAGSLHLLRARLRRRLGDAAGSDASFERGLEAARSFGHHGIVRTIEIALAAGSGASAISRLPIHTPSGETFTTREIEVLEGLMRGETNEVMAARMVVSEHTVHRHVATIYHKLDLHNRSAVAAWAMSAVHGGADGPGR